MGLLAVLGGLAALILAILSYELWRELTYREDGVVRQPRGGPPWR